MRTKNLLLIPLILLGLWGCENQNSNVSAPPDHVSSSRDDGVSIWPPLADTDEIVEVADDPLAKNYLVVFDGSGSMQDPKCSGNKTRIDVAKKAAAHFVELIPEEANIGLVVFDDAGLSVRLPLGKNRNDFLQKISAVAASSGTPLHSAVMLGRRELERQARSQGGYGGYNLVIITDGEANFGQDPREAVNSIVAETPIVVHTVGFCLSENHSLNQPGRTRYHVATSPEELNHGLEEVLAESDVFKDTTGFGN